MGKGWVFLIGLVVGIFAATIVLGITGTQFLQAAKGRFFPSTAA